VVNQKIVLMEVIRDTVIGVVVALMGAQAAEPGCGQQLVDGTNPPATASYIYPRRPVTPFYQWENNDGYCGEVSMMQAGLNNGQWMSQYNARLICGTGLSQSGPNGACAAHHGKVNNNAQLLIENPGTGVTGPNTYAYAALCLANSRLSATTFDYTQQEQYMSWVKKEVISGRQVTIAVLINGGEDPQYDHEVTVEKIGTNHAPSDSSYYPDDVIYFDDHGAYTLSGHRFTSNPAIPPGAGADAAGCTPFLFGYTFGSLANTRLGANRKDSQAYSIVIPGTRTIYTANGGDGYNTVPMPGPHNYAFSVAGPQDLDAETLPVTLTIIGPTVSDGQENPLDPVAGYNYENPMIGRSAWGESCTNQQPPPMTNFTLQATVGGLEPSVAYNLYEYEFSSVTGEGANAALAVPVERFNASASAATAVTHFTATGPTFTKTITTTSDRIVVFRCVAATAP
jgi:hypothetical protein